MKKHMSISVVRKWSRIVHRDLSYLFAGVLIVYAVSGIFLNHKRDFNSDYLIKLKKYDIARSLPASQDGYDEALVKSLLEPLEEDGNYTKHYFPSENTMKVFLKGGSSLTVNTRTGAAQYESVKKRPILGSLNRLHYNPSKNWTVFSDIFAACLIVITITGLVMVKGKKGLWGRGGIELSAGIAIPLLFIFFL